MKLYEKTAPPYGIFLFFSLMFLWGFVKEIITKNIDGIILFGILMIITGLLSYYCWKDDKKVGNKNIIIKDINIILNGGKDK